MSSCRRLSGPKPAELRHLGAFAFVLLLPATVSMRFSDTPADPPSAGVSAVLVERARRLHGPARYPLRGQPAFVSKSPGRAPHCREQQRRGPALPAGEHIRGSALHAGHLRLYSRRYGPSVGGFVPEQSGLRAAGPPTPSSGMSPMETTACATVARVELRALRCGGGAAGGAATLSYMGGPDTMAALGVRATAKETKASDPPPTKRRPYAGGAVDGAQTQGRPSVALAANVRAYRLLQQMTQDILALRMTRSLGHHWGRSTVSAAS